MKKLKLSSTTKQHEKDTVAKIVWWLGNKKKLYSKWKQTERRAVVDEGTIS